VFRSSHGAAGCLGTRPASAWLRRLPCFSPRRSLPAPKEPIRPDRLAYVVPAEQWTYDDDEHRNWYRRAKAVAAE
jgi:hypothetical protein